jgi:DNA polymerase III subunit epsilon
MYAIVDIETTGSNSRNEKMTEIAIVIHDGTQVVDKFESLINPEVSIPPFISRLTGISDDLVAGAPRFYEIACKIVEITEGCIFVAHNVLFDYSFVREEFSRLGYNYKRPMLCTVKLSRKIIPGHPSYSLGNLCASLGITIENRHRAMGDAWATAKLFELLLQKDPSLGGIPTDGLHPLLDKKIFNRLPSSAGVYYFHNDTGHLIYVGKSTNIRQRVLSHFGTHNSSRAMEMKQQISDISWEETGSELVALLLESEEIKKNTPHYNHAQRRTLYKYGLFSYTNQAGYTCLQVAKLNKTRNPVTTFSSFEAALDFIMRLCQEYSLCQKLCNLYNGQHACFYYGIGMCKGACVGEEAPVSYNERVEKAISRYKNNKLSVIIVDQGRSDDELSAVMVRNGAYSGYGYFNPEFTGYDVEAIKDCIVPRIDNRDTNQIIARYLREEKPLKVIPINGQLTLDSDQLKDNS